MEFFIYANSYDPNSGGTIVLHRLCHLINQVTPHSAYLVPFGYPLKGWKKVRRFLRGELIRPRHFRLHPDWNTPVWHKTAIPHDAFAVYPEITNGNPMNSAKVIRWLLHQPGFHTGKIEYGPNELYFKFNSAIHDFSYKNSTLSQNELKVVYYPIDIYCEAKENRQMRDIESCHMIRKGGDKQMIHPQESVALDGKSHQEIADIFRRTKRFICYDDYTAYSIFAVLCGCESVVVPGENVSLEKWYPNESDRYGIAYGISEEQLAWADKTKHKVLEHILAEHEKTEERVKICINEIVSFFADRKFDV